MRVFWAMLSTLQDPNTSNLVVLFRVLYRVPAYGRLCIKLVHSADSLLIVHYNYTNNSDYYQFNI